MSQLISLELQKNALCQRYGQLLACGKEMKSMFARNSRLLESQECEESVIEEMKKTLPDFELEYAQMVRATEPTQNNRANFMDIAGTLTRNL